MNKKKNWNENNLRKIKYKTFKRKHYQFIKLKEGLFIQGYNDFDEEGFIPTTKYITNKIKNNDEDINKTLLKYYTDELLFDSDKLIFKGWSLFDSLIDLRQQLNYPYDIKEDSITDKELKEIENNLNKNEKNYILDWITQYGMPFLGTHQDIDFNLHFGIVPFKFGFKNNINILWSSKKCVFRVGSFLIGLNILYKAFFYFLIYIYQKYNFDNIDLMSLIGDNEYNSISVDNLKEYINRAFNSISITPSINHILEENQTLNIDYYAETILSAAMYQLMELTKYQHIYKSSLCKQCNNIFIPTRKTKLYCMNCSRQKYYQRNNNNIRKKR